MKEYTLYKNIVIKGKTRKLYKKQGTNIIYIKRYNNFIPYKSLQKAGKSSTNMPRYEQALTILGYMVSDNSTFYNSYDEMEFELRTSMINHYDCTIFLIQDLGEDDIRAFKSNIEDYKIAPHYYLFITSKKNILLVEMQRAAIALYKITQTNKILNIYYGFIAPDISNVLTDHYDEIVSKLDSSRRSKK